MTAQEIIERIMSHHWDMVACRCWICVEARTLGFRPREEYLEHQSEIKVAHVVSPEPWVNE